MSVDCGGYELLERPAHGFLRLLVGSVATLPAHAGDGHTRPPTRVGTRRSRRIAPHQHAYVVRPARRSGWRWWLERGDGQRLAAAPGPAPSPQQARADTLRVRIAAATAPVETYEDDQGHFRWRVLSRKGALLAVSAVGYVTRLAADRAVATFRREASHAELHDG